jgi:putative membrane protein
MNTISRSLVACGLAMLASAAAADPATFIRKAGQGGLAEVEAGRLASSRATNSEVRSFGAMMVEDHGAANQKLAKLAADEGVEMPKTYGESHKLMLQSLQAADSGSFDRNYMTHMVKAHEETVQMLKSEIAAGQDPEVKAYAQAALPTVEKHLREAYRIAGRQGAPTGSPL